MRTIATLHPIRSRYASSNIVVSHSFIHSVHADVHPQLTESLIFASPFCSTHSLALARKMDGNAEAKITMQSLANKQRNHIHNHSHAHADGNAEAAVLVTARVE